jgi:hypothetical protein
MLLSSESTSDFSCRPEQAAMALGAARAAAVQHTISAYLVERGPNAIDLNKYQTVVFCVLTASATAALGGLRAFRICSSP